MNYERLTHVSATSKSPNTAPLSTVVNAARWIRVLIMKHEAKSAMSWGTVGLMWSLPTSED